jgi:hypothetical protein
MEWSRCHCLSGWQAKLAVMDELVAVHSAEVVVPYVLEEVGEDGYCSTVQPLSEVVLEAAHWEDAGIEAGRTTVVAVAAANNGRYIDSVVARMEELD